jgi:hypothetical protein
MDILDMRGAETHQAGRARPLESGGSGGSPILIASKSTGLFTNGKKKVKSELKAAGAGPGIARLRASIPKWFKKMYLIHL